MYLVDGHRTLLSCHLEELLCQVLNYHRCFLGRRFAELGLVMAMAREERMVVSSVQLQVSYNAGPNDGV